MDKGRELIANEEMGDECGRTLRCQFHAVPRLKRLEHSRDLDAQLYALLC